MKRMTALSFVSAFFMFCNSIVIADDTAGEGITEVSIGVELFRWQEFGQQGFSNDDVRLLTEQGPRVSFRFSRNNDVRPSNGYLYNISASLYGGDVEYDGQSQPGGHFSPADVDYAGMSAEFLGGYRLKAPLKAHALDLLAGIGVDSWTREISDGVNSQGVRVRGIEEDYRIIFMRLGVGLEYRQAFWKSLWRTGVKYPVSTKETLDLPAVKLEPGKEPSLFFSYRFQLINDDNLDKGTFFSFIYDSYRFSKSPVVSTGPLLVHQPNSHMDVVSLSIGRAF